MFSLILLPIVAVPALLAAALHDIAARTIPNGLCLGVAVLGLAARGAAGELVPGLLAASLVFLFAAVAWHFRLMGGGDVKLLGACALLLPPQAAPSLILAVALAGGVLGLLYLGMRPLLPAMAPAARHRSLPAGLPRRALRAEAWRIRRGGSLPYGVAIALGTFVTLLA